MNRVYRWNSGAKGRNQTVAFGNTVYTVANSVRTDQPFESQVRETLEILEKSLLRAGSGKTALLSVQVLLTDISNRAAFNAIWCDWIGNGMEFWPQRACYQTGLAPGLLIEIIAVAGRNVTGNQIMTKD